ncbi:MAG: hypothetical protein H9W81_15015 [Enterococcus sp.]|nr:hypothetical protein [Enterococcus sp.]
MTNNLFNIPKSQPSGLNTPPPPPMDVTPTKRKSQINVEDTPAIKEEVVADTPNQTKTKEKPKTKKLSFWVEPSISDKVKKVSYHKNTSVSKIMEKELEEWLENPINFPPEPSNVGKKEETKSNGFYLPTELVERFDAFIKEAGMKKNPILRGIYLKVSEWV